MQDLDKFKPDKIPVWEMEKGDKVTLRIKNLFAIDTCWERKDQLFSNGMILGKSTTLQDRPHAQGCLTKTNGLHLYACCFVCFAYFLLLFFVLLFGGL